MIDGIPVPTGVLVPSALLGITVLLILTGRLVPRRTYDDMVHDRNERLADNRILMQHNADLTEQNTILLREVAPTLNSFLGSLPKAAEQVKAGDDS